MNLSTRIFIGSQILFLFLFQACKRENIEPQKVKSFKIFSKISYKQTPDLTQYGLLPIISHYNSAFMQPLSGAVLTGNPNTDNTQIINDSLKALAQRDYQSGSSSPVFLDIESWSFNNQDISTTINKFISVINLYKENNSNSPLGFYGVIPQTKFQWTDIATTSLFDAWQATNDQLVPIVNKVDFFAPSLYNRKIDEPDDDWKRFSQANLSEVKRLNTNKPVYAFMSPQYTLDHSFLTGTKWLNELEYLKTIGYDGVIIWTSNKDVNGNIIDFNLASQNDWWSATLQFVSSMK